MPEKIKRKLTEFGPRILRMPQVVDRTGLSVPSVYRLVRAGRFPRQVRLSSIAVGWLEHEIDGWLQARVAARDRVAGGADRPGDAA